jgi:hypothetical protein
VVGALAAGTAASCAALVGLDGTITYGDVDAAAADGDAADAFADSTGDAFAESGGDAFAESGGDAFAESGGDAFAESGGDAFDGADAQGDAFAEAGDAQEPSDGAAEPETFWAAPGTISEFVVGPGVAYAIIDGGAAVTADAQAPWQAPPATNPYTHLRISHDRSTVALETPSGDYAICTGGSGMCMVLGCSAPSASFAVITTFGPQILLGDTNHHIGLCASGANTILDSQDTLLGPLGVDETSGQVSVYALIRFTLGPLSINSAALMETLPGPAYQLSRFVSSQIVQDDAGLTGIDVWNSDAGPRGAYAWTDGHGVYLFPTQDTATAATPIALPSDAVQAVAIDPSVTTNVYYTTPSSVGRASADGGASMPAASPVGLSVDSSNVYWAEGNRIVWVPKF